MLVKRNYHITFMVTNHVDRTMRTSYTKGSVPGALNQKAILELQDRIKEEWYLMHMGDPDFVPVPATDPNRPLDDLTLHVTGMMLLECDDDGNLEDWVKDVYGGIK